MSLSVITYMEKELENMYIHLCRRESSCIRLKSGGGRPTDCNSPIYSSSDYRIKTF